MKRFSDKIALKQYKKALIGTYYINIISNYRYYILDMKR